jgi:hypothetical protein
LLARDTTSEDVLEKARKLASKGERITAKVVKQIKSDLESEPGTEEDESALEPENDSPSTIVPYPSLSDAVQDLKGKVASCYLRWPAGCIDALVGNLESLAQQYETPEAVA